MSRITLTLATLYNYYRNPDTKQEQWNPVHLEHVHWNASKGANVIASGLANADGLKVFIWFDEPAGGKTYLPPEEYAALSPAGVVNHWTLTPNAKDRIVKGTVTETMQAAQAAHDEFYTITNVDTFDMGGRIMRHWEASGK